MLFAAGGGQVEIDSQGVVAVHFVQVKNSFYGWILIPRANRPILLPHYAPCELHTHFWQILPTKALVHSQIAVFDWLHPNIVAVKILYLTQHYPFGDRR